MVSVAIPSCAECKKAVFIDSGAKFYGDGSVRCYPKCVRKYERRLNKTRGRNGRFGGKLKGV